MTTLTTRSNIQSALSGFSGSDLASEAERLLAALDYRSDRAPAGQTGDVGDFIGTYPAPNPGTASEAEFAQAADSIHIVFQITDSEIAPTQGALFDSGGFDSGRNRSFIFAAVELRDATYPRGKYAMFTREINKRWQIPTVALFRTTTGRLTLAFAHRRPNLRESNRDVLGNVSLIREINPANPHRAHLDILAALSLTERLRWMDDHHGKRHNFDGLLEAWLDALDTEELNKQFYRQLFAWFIRATDEAEFPDGQGALPPQEHVIRLITRMLFVWFIKEKGLVAEDLFIEKRVSELLKDYNAGKKDSYYRAIVQNLFFATLNTEIGSRRFSRENNADHRNFSVFRYKKEIAQPDVLLELFARTPFINGGLFDCLDSFEAIRQGGVRIDCFTDNPSHRRDYSIPNSLFFGDDTEPGLIDLLNRYKFTVEENTPVEQEVALDPELLGKVFENLLASVNPETQLTARKETGSYYTPRPVVDYMVDEALVATLAQKAMPDDGDADYLQERLRYLLDYGDEFADVEELFTPTERESVVHAIAGVKALDPAVGSGAFPMGILHKLTLALKRLDPRNETWERLQLELATERTASTYASAEDSAEREGELLEISRTFDRYRDSDFGRKLYLIQNSIYGVDIQPIATQIAKLRFFISLAIEQQPTDDANDNYGIRPLPNLETRFVAADTLMGLRNLQGVLTSVRAIEIQSDLSHNRERHFHAGARRVKLDLRKDDARLRRELASELVTVGLPQSDAGKIAAWDPYDQNSRADWFDAGYMFDVGDGFDIVIGNPPYVESRNSLLTDAKKNAYINQVEVDWGETLPRGSDLLVYFLARSPKLINDRGTICLITQNAWLSTDYGKKLQHFTAGKFYMDRIVDTSAKFFSDPDGPKINAVVVIYGKRFKRSFDYEVINSDMKAMSSKSITSRHTMKWGHLAAMPEFFIEMLTNMASRASNSQNVKIGQGLNFPLRELNRPGCDVPVIVKDVRFVATSADGLIAGSRISSTRKKRIPALLMPRGVGRYYCTFNACKAFSYSHVEVYLPDILWETDLHYCLWAYFNSSLAWLFRETTGRRNLGGGMLKAEATDLKLLPVDFDFDFAEPAKEVFKELTKRVPFGVVEELSTDEHVAIDEMVFRYFGFSNLIEPTQNYLTELVEFRARRSSR